MLLALLPKCSLHEQMDTQTESIDSWMHNRLPIITLGFVEASLVQEYEDGIYTLHDLIVNFLKQSLTPEKMVCAEES